MKGDGDANLDERKKWKRMRRKKTRERTKEKGANDENKIGKMRAKED